jgi:ribosomal protein S18 acetylase RimI-like enzyme
MFSVDRDNRGTITLQRIEDPGDEVMIRLLPLYEEAFPPAERREAGQLRRVIKRREAMHFNAIRSGGELAGLFVYWDLQEFYYLEHLAVFSALREQRIGTKVLEYIASHLPGMRLLEVEPPVTPMAARRVAYYERNGYEVLDTGYVQPPYDGQREGCPLWIMGNGRPSRLTTFVERVKREIYKDNEHM